MYHRLCFSKLLLQRIEKLTDQTVQLLLYILPNASSWLIPKADLKHILSLKIPDYTVCDTRPGNTVWVNIKYLGKLRIVDSELYQ